MTAKTRVDFSFNVSMKHVTQNYRFQKSGWFLFSGILPDYWTHGFPVRTFCENFSVISYYEKDIVNFNVLFTWLVIQVFDVKY